MVCPITQGDHKYKYTVAQVMIQAYYDKVILHLFGNSRPQWDAHEKMFRIPKDTAYGSGNQVLGNSLL